MKFIKTYELFSLFSRKNKNKTWQEKFDDVYNFYIKNKNKENIPFLDIPQVSIKPDSFYVSVGMMTDNEIFICFYGEGGKGERNMEVVDFSEYDRKNPKSDKGVYPITKGEYEEYLSKTKEMSDWLDDRSEKNLNKTKSTVGSGEFNFNFNEADLALDELNYNLKKELPINKEFEFELSYYLWSSKSSNELVIERHKLSIDDVMVEFGGGRFYASIITKDPFGQKSSIWIEENTSTEYYDFEKNPKPYDFKKIIRMNTIKLEMTRKQEREAEENRKYPYAFAYDITPSKYDSMEFIRTLTEILLELNKQLKNHNKND
jgi:hypothetical protein